MRLGEKLHVLINVPEELHECYMIRLALQPLVENAIHHGLPAGEETGLIRVLGYQEDGDLFFSVSDNGDGIAPEELAHTAGLYRRLQQRLHVHRPTEHPLPSGTLFWKTLWSFHTLRPRKGYQRDPAHAADA